MTLHIIDVEQGTEEWMAARRGIVTASVVGQLITPTLKVADNDTSKALTRLLVAERISGYTDPTFQNGDMFRGTLEEPRARDHYSEHYAPAAEVGLMIRDDWGFSIGASPDGLVGDAGGLEVKSPRQKEHLRTVLDDEVPDRYMAQVQCSLLVSGRGWWDFASWCPPMPMWVKRVQPSALWFTAILRALDAFEVNAWAMTDAYRKATAGLPQTERLVEQEIY